ncbi:hypothetical protein [Microcella sp.]|uniref:hypothetical protein n=1 Tax=Microcella sp. TaxID=1913979 RepID=UPI00391DB987
MPAHTRTPARPFTLGALGTSTALIAGVLVSAPVSATTFTGIADFGELQARLVEANLLDGADTIRLAAGVSITGTQRLIVDGPLTLDLNGGTLEVPSIIAAAGQLRITNGTLTADASGSNGAFPGIGVDPAASLRIDAAFVTATGSDCDAGIGGYSDAIDNCTLGDSATPGALTIENSVVTATGGEGAAGIGGGFQGTLSTLTIVNSRVDAQGGAGTADDGGAGLGGGAGGDGGIITLTNSTVNATGGQGAAGIGGGGGYDTGFGIDAGNGAVLTIDGGTVSATGVGDAAGIGGGVSGNGGSTTITGDAIVNTLGDGFGASIGGGRGGAGGTTSIGGTATVNALHTGNGSDELRGIGAGFSGSTAGTTTTITDGTPTLLTALIEGDFSVSADAVLSVGANLPLTLRSTSVVLGSLEGSFPGTIEIPSEWSLTNEGRIDGSARLLGEGLVNNQGSICAPIDDEATDPLDPTDGLTVTGNAFYLPYRYPAGFTVGNAVYAPTMQEGCRGFPDASFVPDGETVPLVNVGWTLTEDGSGPFVTETTPLASVAPSQTGTFWPTMVAAEITATPTPGTVAAGETSTIGVTGPWPLSNAPTIDLTDRASFSDEGQTPGAANGELSFTEQGEKTVTASVDYLIEGAAFVATDTATILVAPAALSTLEVTPSASTVPQGGSVLLEVSGRDAFGNELTILPGDITVTSSVATDVIDGLRVTFPTASPHVLTVTVGDISESVTIEVVPALASTGANDPMPIGMLALLLMTLGAFAVFANRAPRIRSQG